METISILSAALFVKKRISNSFVTLDGPSKQSQYKQVVKLGVVALGDTQNDSIRSWNFGKNWCNSISDSIVTDKNSNQTVILFKQLYNSKRLAMIQFNWQFNSVGTPVSDEKVFVYNENWAFSKKVCPSVCNDDDDDDDDDY